jgi:hypothetical protein
MKAEGYSVHVYCDNKQGHPFGLALSFEGFPDYTGMREYHGLSKAECYRNMKRHGWREVLRKDFCPACVLKGFASRNTARLIISEE